MARGVNKVILVGNLGQDPELRYSASGSAMCSVSLATSESWKDKQTGDPQERTEWHRLKFFGKLAEIAGEYLKKGRQVYVEGSIRTSKYTDKEGIERYSTDIIVNQMQMLGGNQGGEPGHAAAPRQAHNGNRTPAPQRAQSGAPRQAPPPQRAAVAGHADASNGEYPPPDMDDIPFAPLRKHCHW